MFFGTMNIARRVVFQAIEDSVSDDVDIRNDALKWIRSDGFDAACDEGSLDPSKMRTFLSEIMKLPVGIRRKQVDKLLSTRSS